MCFHLIIFLTSVSIDNTKYSKSETEKNSWAFIIPNSKSNSLTLFRGELIILVADWSCERHGVSELLWLPIGGINNVIATTTAVTKIAMCNNISIAY